MMAKEILDVVEIIYNFFVLRAFMDYFVVFAAIVVSIIVSVHFAHFLWKGCRWLVRNGTVVVEKDTVLIFNKRPPTAKSNVFGKEGRSLIWMGLKPTCPPRQFKEWFIDSSCDLRYDYSIPLFAHWVVVGDGVNPLEFTTGTGVPVRFRLRLLLSIKDIETFKFHFNDIRYNLESYVTNFFNSNIVKHTQDVSSLERHLKYIDKDKNVDTMNDKLEKAYGLSCKNYEISHYAIPIRLVEAMLYAEEVKLASKVEKERAELILKRYKTELEKEKMFIDCFKEKGFSLNEIYYMYLSCRSRDVYCASENLVGKQQLHERSPLGVIGNAAVSTCSSSSPSLSNVTLNNNNTNNENKNGSNTYVNDSSSYGYSSSKASSYYQNPNAFQTSYTHFPTDRGATYFNNGISGAKGIRH